MSITPQEYVLQQRLRQLDRLARKTAAITPTDPFDVKDRDALQQRIGAQQKALQQEQAIRSDYRLQAEALRQIRAHEQLKDQLRQTMVQREPTAAERAHYHDSREKCRQALVQAKVPAADPLDTAAAPAQLLARQKQLQADYLKLRSANADLYKKGYKIADPCMSCHQDQVDQIERNIEHRRRADRSKGAFSGKQQNKDTCALMSAQSILLETKGKAPPEGWSLKISMLKRRLPTTGEIWHTVSGGTDMIDIGEASGGYTPCNGTRSLEKVMDAAGIPSDLTRKPSLDDIARALDEGKAVVVGYDARPVWNDTTTPTPLGHAVRVTGVDRDMSGNVRGFYINDSGNGKANKFVPAKTFQAALDGFRGGQMAVSTKPIQANIGN